MNNDILDYLRAYSETVLDRRTKTVNKFFKHIVNFNKSNLITDEQADLLAQDIFDYNFYVLKILAECPSLKIEFSNPSKTIVLHKYPRQPKQITNAIGFVVDSEEDEQLYEE